MGVSVVKSWDRIEFHFCPKWDRNENGTEMKNTYAFLMSIKNNYIFV